MLHIRAVSTVLPTTCFGGGFDCEFGFGGKLFTKQSSK